MIMSSLGFEEWFEAYENASEIGKLALSYRLTEVEAKELYELLNEMKPKNFKSSKELSDYIVKYKLGYKYPNISGIVEMEQNAEQWDFYGGFPTEIYKIICNRLGLSNQNTDAKPIGFRHWEDSKKS